MVVGMSDGFEEPDWNAPLDIAARLALVPDDVFTRGMYLSGPRDRAARASGQALISDVSYVAYKQYPMRELVRNLPGWAAAAYPGKSPKQALRMMGHHLFAEFRSSLVGSVIFTAAIRTWKRAISLAPRAYSTGAGSLNVLELDDHGAILELRGQWDYPDSYHIGIIEGGLFAYNVKPRVLVRTHTSCDLDLRFVIE